MKLNPSIPPGRSNRKARAFSLEIARLAHEGYGCKAVREALAESGLVVSKSTVQRELARLSRRPLQLAKGTAPAALPALPVAASPHPPVAERGRPAEERRSGKEVAEAFMKTHISNPLLRKRF